MQGKKNDQPENQTGNIGETGTFKLSIKRIFLTRIDSKDYPQNNGQPQATVIWVDPETDETIAQPFLKLPKTLGLSSKDKYRSKFQQVMEALYGAPLTEEDSENVDMRLDFIETWEDLEEAVAADDIGRPAKVEVKGLLVHGVDLMKKEANVTIIEDKRGDKTYYKVTTVAALPRTRGKGQQAAATPTAKPATPAPAPTTPVAASSTSKPPRASKPAASAPAPATPVERKFWVDKDGDVTEKTESELVTMQLEGFDGPVMLVGEDTWKTLGDYGVSGPF
jgi:hypothetical protein